MAQTNGQEVISYRKRQIFGTKNLLFEKLLLRIFEAEKSHLDLKQYKKMHLGQQLKKFVIPTLRNHDLTFCLER